MKRVHSSIQNDSETTGMNEEDWGFYLSEFDGISCGEMTGP